MSDTAVQVREVAKTFRIYRERNQTLKAALLRGRRAKYEQFWALNGVSFDIRRGTTFGLVGPNGSGKSTMLKCMARILTPNSGEIRTSGRLAALLELGSGFHPELSGRENVYLNGSILGLRRSEIDARFEEIVDFAGVDRFIDQPVKNYSSGMYVRLAFAVAINVDPEILLVDEVLAVGDATFQEKCLKKFADFRDEGRTVVIVSHALGLVRQMCDEVAWFQEGKVIDVGHAGRVLDEYGDSSHSVTTGTESETNRRGTGEVRIESVEMVHAGRPAVTLKQGAATSLRVRYVAHERIRQPVVALGIYSASGVHVWGSNLRSGGIVPDSIEGEGEVYFEIPRLCLRPGRYFVNAGVHDYTLARDFDHIRGVTHFDVLHSAGGLAIGGVVEFGGAWDVRPGHWDETEGTHEQPG